MMIMNKIKIILSAIFLLTISFLFVAKANNAYADEKNNTICKGVFIDEVDVSGMTGIEAKTAVDDFVESLRNKGLSIAVAGKMVNTTLGDLGYTYEPNDNIAQALSIGKTGNLIKRYKDLKDIEQGSIVFPLTFKFDDNKLMNLIAEDASAYNIAPIDAKVARKNGQFIYTDHVIGSKIDVNATAELVKNAINNWDRKDILMNAVMVDDIPLFTTDIVKLCKDKLGTFTTEYVDSAEGRAANLANGARLINNAIVYPGEIFSSYKYLTPFTEKNGYYMAKAYQQGKVIDSVGGGACQVTTTLYNAILLSELNVVERAPHSMTISYVDLSRDAAIAGTYKDFKFMNSTDVPILIEATTVGRKITFNIWGHETRNTNRTIEYITKVTGETKPPADVVTEDPTQPTTYRKVTQSAHTGYRAELYKVVYEDGKEVSRTLVNKSTYAAAPRYITIGTKKVTPKPDTDKPKEPEVDRSLQEIDEAPEQTQSNNNASQDQTNGDVWDPTWDLEIFE
jgi:vancomycin resistance protein YoaR